MSFKVIITGATIKAKNLLHIGEHILSFNSSILCSPFYEVLSSTSKHILPIKNLKFDDMDTNMLRVCVHLLCSRIRNCISISRSHISATFDFTTKNAK